MKPGNHTKNHLKIEFRKVGSKYNMLVFNHNKETILFYY